MAAVGADERMSHGVSHRVRERAGEGAARVLF
jgi:hypothetical protein